MGGPNDAEELWRHLRQARFDALGGDFDGLEAVRALYAEAPEGAALRILADTLTASAGIGAEAPGFDALEELAPSSPPGRWCAAMCGVELARDAVLASDLPRLTSIHGRLKEQVGSDGPDDVALHLEVLDLWCALLAEPAPSIADTVAAVEQRAVRADQPDLAIELAALAALASLASGDLEEAIRRARRASRMGRTESLPQLEYLANMVLARVRRSAGRPHLATRILTALAGVAPPRWHGWLAWELVLAGAVEAARSVIESAPPSPVERATVSAIALLDARPLSEGTPGLAEPLATDRRNVMVALGAGEPAEADPMTAGWCEGAGSQTPPVLTGLVLRPGPLDETPCVVVGPGRPARRVLACSLPMLGLSPGETRQPRTETAVAVLAFAPDGLDRGTLFERVYGFAFDPPLHRDAFDVLLHRVRLWLSDGGDLEAVGEDGGPRYRLRAESVLAVPDPRCERPSEERVLRALAERGGISARDAARELGVPLRTVQLLLKQLVEEGACTAERQGRRVRYVVEDTTFQEPTRR